MRTSLSLDVMLCHWISGSTYSGTQCYIPEDSNPHPHCCESFSCNILWLCFASNQLLNI